MPNPTMPTRWFNQRLPQTLVVSEFLLYFNVFWAVLALLAGGGIGLLGLIVIGANLYGAAGVASEMRTGYRVAVAASFFPLAFRFIVALGSYGGLLRNLGFVFFGDNLINVIFEYLLIVVLLHSQSREYQKIWFH